ncbi:PP2C family serine/threonine-protein phosphatase [Prochlorothrix hollandica]|uniref:PPM-type phosphatase domain-containing protein n=1 Tax=Prochlorothrix hollandica PCC 9006 = CALU 1027 TaxID=317619 RepID=A0A0M2Q1N0_PROHO|nr:PP2C family serine/threonine-protein phosphatase [Prochlorothrix hollandica]KKJ01213.1 hypothetical protein PROH_02175 [Prochlorothrix hollandica PCC 9006 = CALU 1027]
MLSSKIKNCLTKIFLDFKKLLHLELNTAYEDQGSEAVMAERKVKLNKEEYDNVIKKWPAANPAIIKISKPGSDIYYETEVRSISKIDDIPKECVAYIQRLKEKQIPPKNAQKSKATTTNKKSQTTSQNFYKDEPDHSKPLIISPSGLPATLNPISLNTSDIQKNTSPIPSDYYYYVDPPKLSIEEYPYSSESWNWIGISDYVVGASHLKSKPAVPCQDTALATILDRPIILVSDGAGSCKLSHFGSNAVVRKLSHFIAERRQVNSEILDVDKTYNKDSLKNYAMDIIEYAMQVLQQEAESKNDKLSSFQCTLSIVTVGTKKSFWLRVGDSPIIVQRMKSTDLLGTMNKGEFSNQTSFLSENLSEEQIQYGLVDMDDVRGFCSLSDGAAEKLMSSDGKRIAPAISKLLDSLRIGELLYQDLHDFLSDSEYWIKTTGDDKSFAALAFQSNR